jgi:glucokinase
MATAVIGIDLGGTRIKAAVLDAAGNLVHRQTTETRDDSEALWKQTIKELVQTLAAELNLAEFSVGISAPGIPTVQNTAIAYMPGRLEGLQNFDWATHLGCKAWVLNDAVAALVAEAAMGAAQGQKNVVLLTLGTGVGGAILVDGKPYQGYFQKGGHIGHMAVDGDPAADVTGMPGSLENAIGNCTVQKRSFGKFRDTKELLQAYRQGDHFARWVWLNSVQKLAIGIASVTNVLSPGCVVLGGGITEAANDLFEPLESFLSLYEWRPGGSRTCIKKAQFGDSAGSIGAAIFAFGKTMKSKKETK